MAHNSMTSILGFAQDPLFGLPAVFVLSAVLYRVHRRTKRKAGMLLTLVFEAKQNLFKKPGLIERIKRARDMLYYPSSASVLVPLALVGVVAGIEFLITNRLDLEDRNRLSNLIAVEAGLTAIIFPLAIFIIELTGERSETGVRKSEVVLRESFLFPTVMFVLFSLLAFSFLTKIIAGWSLIILTTGGSVWVLFQIVRLLLDDHRVLVSGRQVLKDKVRRSVHLAIDERIGNNILLAKLKDLGVSPGFFGFDDDREDVVVFRSSKVGTVADVDLGRLREFVQDIPLKAMIPEPGAAVSEFKPKAGDQSGRAEIYFTVQIGRRVSEEDGVVLAVKKTAEVQKKDLRNLAAAANEIVDIRPVENYEQVLRAELNRLKDFTLTAIEEKKTGLLRVAMEHYVAVAEAFLEELARCSGNYSSKVATEELGNIFGRWDEIEDTARDVYEFLERAVVSKNADSVRQVAFLPTAICSRAIKFRDHYLFQRFSGYATILYRV